MTEAPRRGDTRQKLLEVAETQFARKGYAGAHLQSIADDIGVQKTALYYYFPSKTSLYTAVLERMVQSFDDAVASALDAKLPHTERLERLITQVNDLFAEHPNYSQLVIRIFVDTIELESSRIQPIIQHLIGSVLTFFREGVEAGAFRKRSARNLFQTVVGMSVFHYAARDFSASVLGVEDIFTRSAVAWRREELRETLLRGVLADDS